MSIKVLTFTGTIPQLTTCLQFCQDYQLKSPPELRIEFSSLEDKHTVEKKLQLLLESKSDHQSISTSESNELNPKPREEIIEIPLLKTPSFGTKARHF